MKRRSILLTAITAALGVAAFSGAQLPETDPADEGTVSSVVAGYRLLEPRRIPDGIAVTTVRLEAIGAEGGRVEDFNGRVMIDGLSIESLTDPPVAHTSDVFRNGLLEISLTSTGDGEEQLVVAAQGITITHDTESRVISVPRISRWWRLAPPLIAIALAIALRDVNVALLLALFSGCLLLSGFTHLFEAFGMTATVLIEQLADHDHAQVILFTTALGGMVALMNASGGTPAVVNRLARLASDRRRGQTMTWVLGMLVFFDDYANTLLIGGAMRKLCDRLRISREKLAFIIDSTAAPVAGLAIVSTWAGYEMDQIETGLAQIGQLDASESVYSVFIATIPYRIYPILMLVTVGAIAVSGRDFGMMRKAESALSRDGHGDEAGEAEGVASNPLHAIAPIAVLLGSIVYIYTSTPSSELDSYRMLVLASFAACATAFVTPLLARQLPLAECSRSALSGAGSMLGAIVVLILAWSVSDICRDHALDTGGFVSSLVGDSLSAGWMPTIAFLVSAAISFAIGSSYATMGLLIPLFTQLTWSVMTNDSSLTPALEHPILLGAIGAILAGSIFGDHCSPISDTTVLSSAAANCDHLRHVTTQLPYALVTGSIAILLGYLPIGFGVPWWVAIPAGAAACIAIVLFLGRLPQSADSEPSSAV